MEQPQYLARDFNIARTLMRRNPYISIRKVAEGSLVDMTALLHDFHSLSPSQKSQYTTSLPSFLSSKQLYSEKAILSNTTYSYQFLKGVDLTGDVFEILSEEAQATYLSLLPSVIQIISSLHEKGLFYSRMVYRFCQHIDGLHLDIQTLVDLFTLSVELCMEEQMHSAVFPFALKALANSCSRLYKMERVDKLLLDSSIVLRTVRHILVSLQALFGRTFTFQSVVVLTDCTNMVTILSDHHQWAKVLFAEDIIGVLCSGLSTICSSPSNETTCGAFVSTLLCLRQMITMSLSRSKEVLRSDLIGNIAHMYLRTCAQPALSPLLPSFSTEVNGTLRPLLLYGSALRIALESVNKLSNSERTLLARDGVIGTVWTGLERLLLDRAVAHCLFSFHRRNGSYKCCNPECKWKSQRRFLYRCAACREAAYCSKLCQMRHWRNYGHRKECRGLRDFARVMEIRLIRDRAFVIFLASMEVERRLQSLRKLATAKFPSVPFDRVGFHVEFCTSPMAVDVFEILEEQGSDSSNYSHAVNLALKADNELSVLRITVDRGQRVCTLHAMTRFNKVASQAFNTDNKDLPYHKGLAMDPVRNTPEINPTIIDWFTQDFLKRSNRPGCEKSWNISLINARIDEIYEMVASQRISKEAVYSNL